jgi:hypothetical protein
MATARRTAIPTGSILGLAQASAITAQADPKESGTALAAVPLSSLANSLENSIRSIFRAGARGDVVAGAAKYRLGKTEMNKTAAR